MNGIRLYGTEVAPIVRAALAGDATGDASGDAGVERSEPAEATVSA
jgi:hypothetical protein